MHVSATQWFLRKCTISKKKSEDIDDKCIILIQLFGGYSVSEVLHAKVACAINTSEVLHARVACARNTREVLHAKVSWHMHGVACRMHGIAIACKGWMLHAWSCMSHARTFLSC